MADEETQSQIQVPVISLEEVKEENSSFETSVLKEINSLENNEENKNFDISPHDSTLEVNDSQNNEEYIPLNVGDVPIPKVDSSVSVDDAKERKIEISDILQKADELDEKHLSEYLSDVPEDELLEILQNLEEMNLYLAKENEVYEHILNEDERVQNSLDGTEIDEDQMAQISSELSFTEKCCFAKKKLESVEKEFELKRSQFAHEQQSLNFELESLNISLKDLTKSKDMFNKHIRIGGRHPVTKKIILQKVIKFFEDSIRNKMALANRYKIQIQNDIMERNKILSQIKAQEKRLASLDMTEFQEAQFEYKKSCRQLTMYKEQLGKFKLKFSQLLQSIAKMKKALEKEQNEMEQMKSAVSKLKHLKKVMLTEKTRNDQKLEELRATMRKIKLDPRRHNLPEVIDYVSAKRENASLKTNIDKWNKKLELVEQEKFLYLSNLSKKSK